MEIKKRVDKYTDNEKLKESIEAFIVNREKNKKPVTDRALKTILKKLDLMFENNDDLKIEAINEAVEKNWNNIYDKRVKDFSRFENKETKLMFEIEEKEMVNHPSHYNKGIEAIDYIESHNMNFNIGNVIKYITRAKHKGTELQDLKKGLWYLQREIDKLENKGE